MAFVVLLFAFYILWGAPALVAVTYFGAKSFHVFGIKEALFLFCIEMFLFFPLLTGSRTFFSEMYVPWYIGFLFAPPNPIFSFIGLLVTAMFSILSIVAVYWLAIR